jgi:methanethiol S-methyltransferase
VAAWVNFCTLLISTGLSFYFYVKSVQPAALEEKIGPSAYRRCGRYRVVSGTFMFVVMANYIIYHFFPLPVPLPRRFPWPWWVSALVALALAIPAGIMVGKGLKDAGPEAIAPKKEHGMYGGIYERVRHPQAWEAVFWFVIALLLHSPFLTLYSLVWLPLEYAMVMAEEPDLVRRFGAAYQAYREKTPPFFPK